MGRLTSFWHNTRLLAGLGILVLRGFFLSVFNAARDALSNLLRRRSPISRFELMLPKAK